ncbi:MAG: cyclopropane fatty acyl phospholipid synthase [Candidatus Pacebacteria bacterium]|nr:cyclopropane fatty acyl phospholipid synthase [Candidatus Paceibacterota bacterium]
MKKDDLKDWIARLIAPAGIKLDGANPWDIKILDGDLYARVRNQGSLGLGEAYMDNWWECDALDQFFCRLLRSRVEERINITLPMALSFLRAKLTNMQSSGRAFEVGEKHYDLGNDLFKAMLGKSMAYSCGYWEKAKDLDSAQEAKFDLICRKLYLRPEQRVLDIGCGWGSFAKYAAEKYGVEVVGITVSKEQAEFARNLCKGLPVEIRLQDYRETNELFDRVVSIGMIEHVGVKNYRKYMQTAKRCLKQGGLSLLHTIGGLKSGSTTDPWINKYIFPNGMIPSMKQLSKSAEGLFVIEDVHNFGLYYDKTLMAWHENFEAAWPRLRNKYGSRFYRMWKYYLLSCAGAFRARSLQLWQIVLSPQGAAEGYKAIR